jgi:hypothetical protein
MADAHCLLDVTWAKSGCHRLALLRTTRLPARRSWATIWATAIGGVTLVVTCCLGLLAVAIVGGMWGNWNEGERIVGSYTGR